MFGIDISNYQNGIDLSLGNYDFAFIKATEGAVIVDRSFHKFAVKLTELNKLIGCYHFARPDISNTESLMKREAQFFVAMVEKEKLIGKAILALDWEREPVAREDLIGAWCDEVERLAGIKPIVYANSSHLSTITKYLCMENRCIWLAQWPSINQIEVGKLPTGAKIPTKFNPSFWQYSSNGKYPNYIGRVDLDYTELNEYEWRKIAGFVEQEKISESMQWAIETGIFQGYPDGTYRPNEYLTRGQAASLMKRLFDYTTNYIYNNVE